MQRLKNVCGRALGRHEQLGSNTFLAPAGVPYMARCSCPVNCVSSRLRQLAPICALFSLHCRWEVRGGDESRNGTRRRTLETSRVGGKRAAAATRRATLTKPGCPEEPIVLARSLGGGLNFPPRSAPRADDNVNLLSGPRLVLVSPPRGRENAPARGYGDLVLCSLVGLGAALSCEVPVPRAGGMPQRLRGTPELSC